MTTLQKNFPPSEDFDKSVYNDTFDMAVHKDVRKAL